MARFRRPAKERPRAGIPSCQPMAVVAMAAALALGAFVADKYPAAKRQNEVSAAAAGPNDAEIYTGSVLYMPDDGKVCRQLLFNNRNGRFTDNGYVDCDQAVYQGSLDVPRQWSVARLQVISSGFFRH